LHKFVPHGLYYFVFYMGFSNIKLLHMWMKYYLLLQPMCISHVSSWFHIKIIMFVVYACCNHYLLFVCCKWFCYSIFLPPKDHFFRENIIFHSSVWWLPILHLVIKCCWQLDYKMFSNYCLQHLLSSMKSRLNRIIIFTCRTIFLV